MSPLVVKKTVRARRERVFEMWRDPVAMSRWLSTPGWIAAVKNDFRVGGAYRIEMRDEALGEHVQFGEYLEIAPVSRLVFTWICREIGVDHSVVTVELEDHGEETGVVLTHALPPDPEIRKAHEDGWNRCLGHLVVVAGKESA